MCRDNGLHVPAVYDYLYYGESIDRWQWRREVVRQVAGDMGNLGVWLDVEDSESGQSVPVITALTRHAANGCEARGLEWGIYTSVSKWTALCGNTTEFAGAPLMDAYYLERLEGQTYPDDIGYSTDYITSRSRICQYRYFRPYGGWGRPTIKQAAGTTQLCDVGVDLNWAEPFSV